VATAPNGDDLAGNGRLEALERRPDAPEASASTGAGRALIGQGEAERQPAEQPRRQLLLEAPDLMLMPPASHAAQPGRVKLSAGGGLEPAGREGQMRLVIEDKPIRCKFFSVYR